MTDSPTDHPEDSEAKARRVYTEFLRRRRLGESLTFASLCVQYPHLVRYFRKLHKSWSEEGNPYLAMEPEDVERFGVHADDETITLTTDGHGRSGEELEAGLEALSASSRLSSRYAVKDELARGGMGRIVKAWDRNLRRTLAMKMIYTVMDTLWPGEAHARHGSLV